MTSVIIIDFPNANPHSNYWQLIDDTNFIIIKRKIMRYYVYLVTSYDYLKFII